MRRWPTWLVVGALVALGAVAAADALRGEGERTVQAKPTARPAPPPSEAASLAVSGALYFSDADDCWLHGVTLPDLGNPAFDPATGAPPKLRSCRFSLSPDGDSALPDDAEWAPFGTRYARQVGDTIEASDAASGRGVRFRGSAPAFKPDGTLTYVEGKRVFAWTQGCQPRCRVVLTAGDIRHAFTSEESVIAVRDLDWLSDTRVAVVVGTRIGNSPREAIAIFEDREAIAEIPSDFGTGLRVEASPRGGYLSAWYGDSLYAVRDRDGDPVVFPPLSRVRALAWSPDERWTAAATEHSVYLFRTNEGEARIRRLPIVARDLAWRAAAPATADVQGVLVVTGADCAPVAFRLPTLEEEEPPRLPDCGRFVWSGDGTLAAVCKGDRTTIFGQPGMLRLAGLRGCAPAWRSDGALSVINDGDLVVARRRGRPQIFLSKQALADALHDEGRASYELAEVAWIDPQTFAAIVAGTKRWQQAVVVATRERVELVVDELGQRISSISVSPHGKIAFARNRLGREFVILDLSGREIALPRIANARAFAWSPDGEWVALATRTSTFIARAGTSEIALRVPHGGDALAWLP